MKKFLSLLVCALLVLGTLAISAFAADTVAYVDYANGNDTNDGLSASAAKKSIDNNNKGAMYYTKEAGGTIVASGKLYFGNDYTLKTKRGGEFVITGAYGGNDYRNPTPANNPTSGVMKMAKGKNLSIATDTTLTDIILFHEFDANPSTIYVKDGAVLTITDTVTCMSGGAVYYTIVVEKGGVANIEGGIFTAITGDGEKNIAKNVAVNSASKPKTEASGYGFINYGAGSDGNSGTDANNAKKLFGTTDGNGVMANVANGGTVVVSGKAYVGADYTIKNVGAPITFTSYYNNVDYKNPDPVTNPACAMKLAKGKVLTIDNDVIFDNIILFEEYDTNEIVIKSGNTVTFTDTVEFMTKNGTHWTVNVESGATVVASTSAKEALTFTGAGTVKDFAAAPAKEKTTVKLTIGSTTAYINGVAQTLDAAPINRNNRTLLPVRFLANAFGVANDGIKWDGATSTATLTNSEVTIVVTIGKPNMTVNGQTVALDAPAIIENGRTYLPVRAIANALGVDNANIAWDAATSTATLVK